jgi:preprotein translocase SecE subunit
LTYKLKRIYSPLRSPAGLLKMPMMNALVGYFKGVMQELTHVRWPSVRLATAYTVLVLVISIILAVYTGALDAFFSYLIDLIV